MTKPSIYTSSFEQIMVWGNLRYELYSGDLFQTQDTQALFSKLTKSFEIVPLSLVFFSMERRV